MKNQNFSAKTDEELYEWAGNFINIYDHYLTKLTPKLKDEASQKLFYLSFKELKDIITVTRDYKDAFEMYIENMNNNERYRAQKEQAREDMKKLISKKIELMQTSADLSERFSQEVDILEDHSNL